MKKKNSLYVLRMIYRGNGRSFEVIKGHLKSYLLGRSHQVRTRGMTKSSIWSLEQFDFFIRTEDDL